VVQSSSEIQSLQFVPKAYSATVQGKWPQDCSFRSDESPCVKLKVSSKTSVMLTIRAPFHEEAGLMFVVAKSQSGKTGWPLQSNSQIVAKSTYINAYVLSLNAADLEADEEYEVWMTLDKPQPRDFTLTCLSSQCDVQLA